MSGERGDAESVRRIRVCMVIVMAGLVVSGVTAFPLVHETGWLAQIAGWLGTGSAAYGWVSRVHEALVATAAQYPFLAYGTDWLAFAHLVLAVVFLGPYRDPVRNRWCIEFGLIACAGVLPLALIAGACRGIPLWWRLGDCCFGVCGAVPLWIALGGVRELERRQRSGAAGETAAR